MAMFAVACLAVAASAQDASRFRVGEKLTYNVSFGKINNAAYAAMSVISRGKLDGREVVELRSRLKTLGLVSAAFFQFDESRTVFAASDYGLPVYVSKIVNYGVEPKETVGNYLKEPTSSFDLLSLVYKAREANGSGSFPLVENERLYTVTFQPTVSERLKTEAGEFDTVVSVVQSDYLTENGIKELKINFAADAHRIPVVISLKTAKGIFKATLADIRLPKPPVETTPATAQTPVAVATPKPVAAPAVYVENQPLSPELGFLLGETLNYKISRDEKPVAIITLAALERKLFQNEDSLHLAATVTGIEQGNSLFVLGDAIHAQVDPDTLAPFWTENRFGRQLKDLNQTVAFDRKSASIMINGTTNVDAPVGTHSLLSLLYAMRSFNLQPSKDAKSPVNDTRVAVFWESQPHIFVLRPSSPEEITVDGEKIQAQMIVVATGIESIDKQGLKIWLAADSRVPVRLTLGQFRAELANPSKTSTK